MTRYDSKRIAIARAIMYKELAKRQEERVIECKRRGLWTLWRYQTKYKTLWHFLRASDDKLIMLCDECMSDLLDMGYESAGILKHFEMCFSKNPCKENEAHIAYYNNLCNRYSRVYHEIKELRNKLKGDDNNENQN